MEVIKLSREMEIKGKKVKKLTLVMEDLKGSDLISAEKQARAMGDLTPQVYLSSLFQAILGAKLIGIPVEDLEEWAANDFSKIVGAVSGFLFKME